MSSKQDEQKFSARDAMAGRDFSVSPQSWPMVGRDGGNVPKRDADKPIPLHPTDLAIFWRLVQPPPSAPELRAARGMVP